VASELFDDDDDDLDEELAPELSLRGAVAWIGTRNAEFVQSIQAEEWTIQFDGSNFEYAPGCVAAWILLRRYLVVGEIQSRAVTFVVPRDFQFSDGGWSVRGGSREIIPTEFFANSELILHSPRPYSALRPAGLIKPGDKWYRDVHVDLAGVERFFPHKDCELSRSADQSQIEEATTLIDAGPTRNSGGTEPPKNKRKRESSKKAYARSIYLELFPDPQKRGSQQQVERLETLHLKLREIADSSPGTKVTTTIGLTLFKEIEKEIKDAEEASANRVAGPKAT
jgi:hypothetical protein